MAVGSVWAPSFGVGSLARHARVLHPEGAAFRCHVNVVATTSPRVEVAERLAGAALARLSTAWWRRGRELPDVLGLALRFRGRDDASTEAHPGDQDLLLATIRHPVTTLLASLTTHVHDFLDNDYYGVSPFHIDGYGRGWLRARSLGPSAAGADRGDRLARAVAGGGARFVLELQRRRRAPWRPLVVITLVEPVDVDQEQLRFSPFRAGRGIHPAGLIHALRAPAYAVSQLARPGHSR